MAEPKDHVQRRFLGEYNLADGMEPTEVPDGGFALLENLRPIGEDGAFLETTEGNEAVCQSVGTDPLRAVAIVVTPEATPKRVYVVVTQDKIAKVDPTPAGDTETPSTPGTITDTTPSTGGDPLADNDPVPVLTDTSGGERHWFVRGGCAMVGYYGPAVLGGEEGISFGGSTCYANRVDPALAFERDEAFSAALSVQIASDFAGPGLLVGNLTASDGEGWAVYLDASNHLSVRLQSDGTHATEAVGNTALSADTPYVLVVTKASGTGADKLALYVNGAAETPTTTDTLATSILHAGECYLGQIGATAEWGFKGYVGEVALYGGALSTAQRQAIETAWKTRYGIS